MPFSKTVGKEAAIAASPKPLKKQTKPEVKFALDAAVKWFKKYDLPYTGQKVVGKPTSAKPSKKQTKPDGKFALDAAVKWEAVDATVRGLFQHSQAYNTSRAQGVGWQTIKNFLT